MPGRIRSGAVLAAAPSPPLTTESAPTRTQQASSGVRAVPDLGPRGYLYLLVVIEVGLIGLLRYVFRDHHGG